MSTAAHDRVTFMLTHYFRNAFQHAGIGWNSGNDAEVARIVDDLHEMVVNEVQEHAVDVTVGATPKFTWRQNRFVGVREAGPDRAEAERHAAICRTMNPGHDVAVVTRLVTEWRDV
jgi:hypothetical protein